MIPRRLQAQALRYWLERAGRTRLSDGHDDIPGGGSRQDLVLAAHGPDTATGAEAVLLGRGPGRLTPVAGHHRVDCISRDSSSFAGLVTALEERFAALAVVREA